MRIIISGGSIAGCVAAILLSRIAGITVEVYERSNEQLSERGAGIVLPKQLLQQCIELKLFDATIPHIPADSRTFWVTDPSTKALQYMATTDPIGCAELERYIH